ncbi:MAG: flagellin N-terminal helical domain-containing protein, partial [Planctomycetota bacterium]
MSGILDSTYSNVSFALRLHAEAMARLQEQASTGSRINRSSDDPSAGYRVLGLNSQARSFENYIDNLSEVMNTLQMSYSAIENIASTINDLRTDITQITSGIFGQDARERAAGKVNEMLEHIVSFANFEHMNQYLFGGGDTASAPYAVTRTNGEITSVTYQGSLEERKIEVASGVESSAFYIGDDIFRSSDRSAPTFFGNTGATAGTGTSSINGYVWLEITEPVAGTYRLSIDDDPTSFVDVAVPPGSANTVVTHADTGEILYVDTTGIANTGVELVSVSGTHDIFNSLITTRDIMKNVRGFSDARVTELLEDAASSLEEISNLLAQSSVAMGSKIGLL